MPARSRSARAPSPLAIAASAVRRAASTDRASSALRATASARIASTSAAGGADGGGAPPPRSSSSPGMAAALAAADAAVVVERSRSWVAARAQLIGARLVALVDDGIADSDRLARALELRGAGVGAKGTLLVASAIEAALAAPGLAPRPDGALAVAEVVWAVGQPVGGRGGLRTPGRRGMVPAMLATAQATSSATTDGIEVTVRSRYLPEQSAPDQHRYVFAYTVAIANRGAHPAQLRTRHWVITDGRGGIEEVRGDGVVGELDPARGWGETNADRVCAIDDHAAVALADGGVEGDRLLVVGAIGERAFVEAGAEARATLAQRFGLTTRAVVIEVAGLGAEATGALALQLSLADVSERLTFLFDAAASRAAIS